MINDSVADPPPPTREPMAPHLSLFRLFARFLRFGLLAFGGPVAQIAMLREELVERESWVSRERFHRALAVYQVLPGPEAHELCCWFGMLARGRAGALVAGLGFMLPGFVFMYLLSAAYVRYGLGSIAIAAAFLGVQPAIAALIARAVHRIGSHTLAGPWLWSIGVLGFASQLLEVPFWIPLTAGGAAFALVRAGRRKLGTLALVVGVCGALGYVAVTVPGETPSIDLLWRGSSPDLVRDAALPWWTLLLAGLKAGLLTFGGAYTAIPFLRRDAVEVGGWLSDGQFIDGVALSGILPAPLIIFSTFIGYVAGGPLGAIAITVGIFAPAFAFTIIGHRFFERWIGHPPIHGFLDGVSAGVVGLIAATFVEVVRGSVTSLEGVAIFLVALATQLGWNSRWAIPAIVVGSACVGMIVFR